MPAVFFGHGSPMNALGGPHADGWRKLGADLPKPKAVLMVSAHWETDGTAVTADENPRTIHDFYGFPQALFDVRYPAPGSAALVGRVGELVGPGVRWASDWGLDHGAWSVLVHAFPKADIPVVQLSLDRRLDAAGHYALARKLRPLRDEGVLIAGSGDFVHNLRTWRREPGAAAYDWATRFNEAVKAALVNGDHDTLVNWIRLGEDAQASVPTPEHFLPLLYVAAQQDEGEAVSFFNDVIEGGSISMTGVKVG
ncbi:4,5-DOPA dioxygenase extradiol [Caulobacter sp. 17J65-9]|nr:4,5-DOPA dioxygenase extradiol [Caulobacter sp. 17J65-9]